MSLLLISASLDAESRSRALLQHAATTLRADGTPHEVLDLRDLPLPLCDGGPAYQHPNVAKARALVAAADGILAATPIYNYDANAALKNLVELTGQAWENKVVAFLCAAGGHSSYMSIMALANSLMLDFRCVILPRFVYATGAAFTDEKLSDPKILDRTAACARATARLAAAVKGLAL